MANKRITAQQKNCCPFCQQRFRAPDIIVSLEHNLIFLNGVAVSVEPKKAELLQILIDASPHVISREGIIRKLYGINEPGNAEKTLMQHMHTLRKILEPRKFNIKYFSERGYQLVKINQAGGIGMMNFTTKINDGTYRAIKRMKK